VKQCGVVSKHNRFCRKNEISMFLGWFAGTNKKQKINWHSSKTKNLTSDLYMRRFGHQSHQKISPSFFISLPYFSRQIEKRVETFMSFGWPIIGILKRETLLWWSWWVHPGQYWAAHVHHCWLPFAENVCQEHACLSAGSSILKALWSAVLPPRDYSARWIYYDAREDYY